LAVTIEWAFARSLDWTAYPRSEWVALFDLCVFMPCLYWLAFASGLPRKARRIRTAGIVGIGLFAASWIVPEAHQVLIGQLSDLRSAILAVVLMFEGVLLWKVINAAYLKGADAQQLEREFAMPEWIAKLMVLEARFWKAVWTFLRRK
jgi:hypothetical protein